MIVELSNISELPSDKSQQFIRQLYSLLKSKDWSSFGNGSYAKIDENGYFVTGIYHVIEHENIKSENVLWIITQGINGTILKIEVDNEESQIQDSVLKEYFYKITQKALINTLSNFGTEFFCRNYYCFVDTRNLQGEFWVNKKLRIAPLYPEDSEIGIGLERIIVFDQLTNAIDRQHSLELSEESGILLSAHLSLLLDIGIYPPRSYSSKWVRYYREDSTLTNRRLELGVVDTTNQYVMPKKINANLSRPNHTVYYKRKSFGEDLNYPKELRIILKSLENVQAKYKLAFDRCCRLYQTALVKGIDSPTIKFSYLYGSIDAICQTTKEFKGFSDFMRNYCPTITDTELDFIHEKIRSSHWHSGEFVLGENESSWREFLFNRERMIRSSKIENLQQTIRHSILKWTFEKIVNK